MIRKKLTFDNGRGQKLAATLEEPDGGDESTFALFAHCFTCSKDIAVASRISRGLVEEGIGVVRFDFTGLGNSEGDFSNTNFSSNVEDLVAAADHLRERYRAPRLLVGHSLGGAAVLVAAARIAECRAVATIGAPSDVGHVSHLFAENLDQIEERGEATVDLAGRRFKIKKQFLDDIGQQRLEQKVHDLRRALLIFHSPFDSIVSIDHAARLFKAVLHPKSFVSLDDADHLLGRPEDSLYVSRVLAAWASRFLTRSDRGD